MIQFYKFIKNKFSFISNKQLISIFLIIIISLNPIYSLSLFPTNNIDTVYSNIKLEDVNRNTNHKLVEINRISYTFTGNEDNPVNKQDIPILKQENNQLLLDDNPDYISYSSISKLTNNKEITYYTRDHISSNRITTNNQGNTVYQANFQP